MNATRATLAARLILGCALAAAAVGGCESHPRSPLDRLAPQPEGLEATTIVLLRDEPNDTDGDGLADQLTVSTHLFPDETRHSQPLWLDGTFTFSLATRAHEPVQEWTFGSAEAETCRRASGGLRHYVFRLDFPPELQRRRPESMLIMCSFAPADAGRVARSKFVALRVGRAR